MDVVITLLLLAIAGVCFSAMFPSGIAASREAREYKTATAIVQRKMEQLRAMRYESLTATHLAAGGVIDQDDPTSPFSFTSVDSVGSQFAGGAGEIAVDDVTSDIRRVRITVSWDGPGAEGVRNVRITSLFADRRTRQINP